MIQEFTDEEYSKWLLERRNAEVAIEDRDTLLFESARSAECRLELLGATGIEDKLQTKVPEAIADLLEAGMKVWVLTGDKQETAINVGYSTHLINPDMEVVVLNAYSLVSLGGVVLLALAFFFLLIPNNYMVFVIALCIFIA